MTLLLSFKPHEILLLEGNENYTNLYLKNGEVMLSSYTLLRYEQKLNSFLRVSRKHLINPDYISKYCLEGNNPHVVLKSGEKIKIPRRRVREFELKALETV